MSKSLSDLNKKIKDGESVVADAHEIQEIQDKEDTQTTKKDFQAVTSGTRGAALYFAQRLPPTPKK